MRTMTAERWRTASRALTAVLAVVAVIVVGPIWLNATTRIDASQHVSNLPCGPEQYPAARTCPGKLVCAASEPRSPPIFTEQRVGAAVDGARCVTPVFPERYCGVLQGALDTFQVGRVEAIAVSACGGEYEIEKLLQIGPDPRELLDRIVDTNGRGAAWIHEQDLKLLKEDPDSSTVDFEQYMDCATAELAITDISYDSSDQDLTIQIKNIQQHDFPNSTIVAALEDHNTSVAVPAIGAGEVIRVNATARTAPQRIYLHRPYCGPRTISFRPEAATP